MCPIPMNILNRFPNNKLQRSSSDASLTLNKLIDSVNLDSNLVQFEKVWMFCNAIRCSFVFVDKNCRLLLDWFVRYKMIIITIMIIMMKIEKFPPSSIFDKWISISINFQIEFDLQNLGNFHFISNKNSINSIWQSPTGLDLFHSFWLNACLPIYLSALLSMM